MAIKFVMNTLDDVPKDVAALYEKNDNGQFVMTQVEGVTSTAKLKSFRDNNIKLMNDLEKFKDVDLDAIAKLRSDYDEAVIKLENSKGTDEETLNKLVEARVSKIKESTRATIDELNQTNSKLAGQVESMVLNGDVTDAAAKYKVRPEAITDISLRAKGVFKLENGKPVAYSGKDKLYGEDGVTELSVGNWVKSLIKTSPHLFQDSVTGGLGGKGGPGEFKGDPTKLSPAQKIKAGLSGM